MTKTERPKHFHAVWERATTVIAGRGVDLIVYATRIEGCMRDGRDPGMYFVKRIKEAIAEATTAADILEAQITRREALWPKITKS
jgi:hypothetical protein